MASSSDDDELVVLLCTNPNPIESDNQHTQTLISTTDIHNLDSSTILCYRTVRIQAHRNRLVQQSSYFHGLLNGSFSESNLDCVSVQWNLETLVNILKFIYGCPVDITSDNFLSLFEAALYFGIEPLILKCKNWFAQECSSKGPGIQLDDLILIWNFSLEHGNDFVQELCVSYLARNFMWAISNNFFGDIPYKLLLCCIKHPHLTVYSEMHLADALLMWLNVNKEHLKYSSKMEDYCRHILKQIRVSILPLWFAAGERRSGYFSELANESIETIFRWLKISPIDSINAFGDSDVEHLRIRLTEYSKKVSLSGCPQITFAILLLSLLPNSYCWDITLRRSINESLINLEHLRSDRSGISQWLSPILSFEAVEEVDISRCPRLHLEATIECFSKSFPSLRKLKAAFLLNFKTTILRKLAQRCPLISEVDITVDTTPLIPAQVSVVSRAPATSSLVPSKSFIVGNDCYLGPSTSNITSLTLEGQSDISDSDLQYISKICVSLCYLNLKGCISISDAGISILIRTCVKLHSVLVCDTSFGINSVQALCSNIACSGASPAAQFGNRYSDTLAYKLQAFHMGGCKGGVGEKSLQQLLSQTWMLKSLCLRGTNLVDDALFSFSGSSLEALDVSDTMISGAALCHVFVANSALNHLNVRGCKNLILQKSNSNGAEISSSYTCKELFRELGKHCVLDKIAVGWGFSCSSLEVLKPAIISVKGITIGLGGSLGEEALKLIPTTCPLLEEITLYFQVISDSIMINIMSSKNLQQLALSYCLGDISSSSLNISMPNLKKLRLEWVTPWMTNNDLDILTQNCANLVELSLLGCRLLNSDSLNIISHGWPGLTSIHLEDCGEVTTNGVSPLFNCSALEVLLLRHNGQGIDRGFIFDISSKMPLLRQLSLDLCDACEGELDIPNYADKCFLRTVKIARCKFQKCSSSIKFPKARRWLAHKETLVLVWNSEHLVRTVVKERL